MSIETPLQSHTRTLKDKQWDIVPTTKNYAVMEIDLGNHPWLYKGKSKNWGGGGGGGGGAQTLD